eukprot:8479404-Alexandrium_andersonii.AAC.1
MPHVNRANLPDPDIILKGKVKAKAVAGKAKAKQVLGEPWWYEKVEAVKVVHTVKGNRRMCLPGKTPRKPSYALVAEIT